MNKLQGGFLVVARWMNKDTLKGFLLVDTTYKLHMAPLESIKRNGYLVPYLNAQYDAQYQTLVGTTGASLTDYPVVNDEYALTKGVGIILMATILDANTKKPIGVVAFNGMGTRFNLTYAKLSELMKKHPPCNFKMVTDPQYGTIAVHKDGSYFDTVEMTPPPTRKTKQGDNPVSQSSPNSLPVIGPYNVESMRDNEFNQSAQEKLLRTMVNMSKLTPYYYTVLHAIKRLPAPIGTMGVTEDTLYYDLSFVSQLKVPELTFVFIHEIMHLAMQHSIRIGGRTNPDLWNIATDLYINSVICKDFGCTFGRGEVDYQGKGTIKTPEFGVYIETIGETIDLKTDTPESIYDRLLKANPKQQQQSGQGGGQNQQSGGGSQGDPQAMAEALQQIADALQEIREGASRAQNEANNAESQQAGGQIEQGLEGVEDAVNDATSGNLQSAEQKAQQGMQDTQSGINDMSQATQQAQSQKAGNPQQGQGQQQSGQGQNGQGNSMTPQEQMQRGMNQLQQGLSRLMSAAGGQGQQGQPGQGQPGQGQGQSGKGQGQQSQGQGQGKSGQSGQQQGQGPSGSVQSNLSVDDFGDPGEFSSMKEVSVIYNGKKLTGTIMQDVLTKNDSQRKEDIQKKLSDSRMALQAIDTKVMLEEKERGESLEKNAGLGGQLTKRYIEVGLSAGVDWRVLFRNIVKDKPKKTFTLAQPNQDYMNMGVTIADRRAIGKPQHISKVKFAIDVSGSVSKKELMVTLSEINNIFSYFKLDGELLYWSTMVGDAGPFSNLKDMLKIEPVTTGGTDCRCVFDYLSGKAKVHGRSESDKVRDIKAVFIITDGCFSMNFDEYKSIFGKKVVWLITGPKGNTITFNPPFGRVLSLNIDM